ncbi:MAG: MFS transporter [Gammaproteobacteria bacterium CG11_big_fil_rev_8_21_14_0_20_46_22]|nr:MAG: MFS transporter [Gammaproteobacteria bacterium CG12_big_fil_rev_8_21_14_0_65_46_12]PIR11847.1 MAG: MFS transporter [Gammaproteobacteria bacterium CG11_big_fil_rev_8_21_14_0_20_46_22]
MEIPLDGNLPEVPKSKSFRVLWFVELWERFGYYGVQAILALYFVQQLGYNQTQSFYVFGSFSAFVYGFAWIGGRVGDDYLGAKRTLVLGATILAFSYLGLALSNKQTVFYALAGIVVGNALFKANPSSLISKLYGKGNVALDSAMTWYYMAVNIGSMISMAMTPIVAQNYGWPLAFGICAIGLFLGVANYGIYRGRLAHIATSAGKQPFSIKRFLIVLSGGFVSFIIIAHLLKHTTVCNWIIYLVVAGAFFYFLKESRALSSTERKRMLVALVLIMQAVLFFVLYNQMATSLTFFALHNINNHVFGLTVPAAEYQVLNSVVIVLMSPLLAKLYIHWPATHITKFCIGMSLCASAFLVLALPQFTASNGLASPWWMVLTYYLQSTGELLVSALGLAMVAELCPEYMSGFVMGVWFLTSMLAGPIGAWVGALTVPNNTLQQLTPVASMSLYSHVFTEIGLVTGLIAILMWLLRPLLNKAIVPVHLLSHEEGK